MSLKKFKIIKIIVVIALAIAVAQAVVNDNYVVPAVAIAISIVVLLFARGRVNEIIADERDYQVGGKAARIAMQIFSWVAIAGMFIFYAWRDKNPSFEAIALTLSYSTCLLLIIYSVIFKYYSRK